MRWTPCAPLADSDAPLDNHSGAGATPMVQQSGSKLRTSHENAMPIATMLKAVAVARAVGMPRANILLIVVEITFHKQQLAAL